MTEKKKWEERYFQQLARDCYLAGEDIIMQAPTSSGKTDASIRPALMGFEHESDAHPQNLIYGVPMRVLANSFVQKYKELERRKATWRERNWHVSIQTGERPEDSLFEGQLVFATVDQMLASFLNIPYGIPRCLDNINAGAFIGSYLVFDEFHLYPSKEMMLTVLAMLKMLKGITRFTLMSATFSPELVGKIGEVLVAKVIAEKPQTPLARGIFKDIDHLKEQHRKWSVKEGILSADRIVEQLTDHRKVLVICNTVDRAQEVYRDFMTIKDDTTDCVLLHSRYYQEHRSKHETTTLNYLCKKSDKACQDDGRRKVVIATQVVEVGLDISADVLLTECAPAASLIQRAGRCARDGGDGEVHVYLPVMAGETDTSQTSFVPYVEDGLEDVAQKTWETLGSTKFDGKILQYDMEQQLIEIAHGDHDREYIINGLENKINTRIEEIIACMGSRHAGYIPQLIRKQSGVPLHIMRDYKSDVITENYFSLEGFNVSQGRIFYAMKQLEEQNIQADFLFARGEEKEVEDREDSRPKTIMQWYPLHDSSQVYDNWRFLVNPDVVGYTPGLGLQWKPLEIPAIEAPEKNRLPYQGGGYDADTYLQHLEGLRRAYTESYTKPDPNKENKEVFYRPLKNEYQFALLRLLKRSNRDDTWDEIDRYIRLTLALHDVGKLNQRWQYWALARHRLYCEMFGEVDDVPADGEPLAHTIKGWQKFSLKEDADRYETAFKQLRIPARGTHSVESAEATQAIVADATKKDPLWQDVIIAAICRHHTPDAGTINSEFTIVDNATTTIMQSLLDYGFDREADEWATMVNSSFSRHGMAIKKAMTYVSPNRNRYYPALLYMIVVRILRLADQRSSDYIHKRTSIGQ